MGMEGGDKPASRENLQNTPGELTDSDEKTLRELKNMLEETRRELRERLSKVETEIAGIDDRLERDAKEKGGRSEGLL